MTVSPAFNLPLHRGSDPKGAQIPRGLRSYGGWRADVSISSALREHCPRPSIWQVPTDIPRRVQKMSAPLHACTQPTEGARGCSVPHRTMPDHALAPHCRGSSSHNWNLGGNVFGVSVDFHPIWRTVILGELPTCLLLSQCGPARWPESRACADLTRSLPSRARPPHLTQTALHRVPNHPEMSPPHLQDQRW